MFSDDVCALTAGGELDCFHLGIGLRWGGTFRAVAVGGDDTCAIRDDGTLFCSGDVEPPPGEFTAVSAGYYYHCGLRTNGEIACWGMLTARNSVSLSPPPGKFALIDAGWQHACAIRTDGVTVCWGANEGGQSTPPSDFP
jgi:alpha-tubulin suppressor-like RCC1 family protein